MFMSDILHLLTIITFECDMFPFTFIIIISATFFFYIHYEYKCDFSRILRIYILILKFIRDIQI